MSGAWLASYIVLWGVVLFQGAVIFLLLRQLGIMYLGTAQGIARDGLPVGERAPVFTLPDLEGQPLSLGDFRGRPLLLVFGTTNCRPCQNLIPDLNVFARERRAQLGVLYLSRGDEDAAREFARAYDVRVPVASHEGHSLPDQYRARVTPFAFLIDGDGVIRAKGLANNREHLALLWQMAGAEPTSAARGGRRDGRIRQATKH